MGQETDLKLFAELLKKFGFEPQIIRRKQKQFFPEIGKDEKYLKLVHCGSPIIYNGEIPLKQFLLDETSSPLVRNQDLCALYVIFDSMEKFSRIFVGVREIPGSDQFEKIELL